MSNDHAEKDLGPEIQPLIRHRGITAPMLLNNIDTDQIIPSREMKKVSKNGLAEGLFAGQRYSPNEQNKRALNPDFILNQKEYEGATILLSQKNFGCGSSREHAVWALHEFGFRVIIAESFGSIFRTNCLRNGVLPITLDSDKIAQLHQELGDDPKANTAEIDVAKLTVTSPSGARFSFDLESHFQDMLIGGLDFISLTLKRKDAIDQFIQRDIANRPWAHL